MDKYHDYNDYEYKGIKDIKDLFKLSIDKDYYEPILVKSGYNGDYVQYESKGDKILTLKEYLALIEKYLRELINYYKNKGERKLQLIAEINFISLNLVLMEHVLCIQEVIMKNLSMVMTLMKSLKDFLNHFYKNMKKIYKMK